MGMIDELYVFKAFRFFAAQGLRKTLQRSTFILYRRTVVRFREWRFDRRFGVHTGGDVNYSPNSKVPLHRLAEPYYATSPELFEQILRSVGCLTAPFTFFDVGCGKGRVLLMAAQHEFARVVGIEFNFDLAQVAEMNATRFQTHPDCQSEINVVCADAAQYQFPDENAVIFFFNPFKQEIMSEVLKNIRLSARATQYRYIIYSNPILENLFSDPNEFSVVAKEKEYVIYRMRL
jgi:SAM-dependent methyltransferase